MNVPFSEISKPILLALLTLLAVGAVLPCPGGDEPMSPLVQVLLICGLTWFVIVCAVMWWVFVLVMAVIDDIGGDLQPGEVHE